MVIGVDENGLPTHSCSMNRPVPYQPNKFSLLSVTAPPRRRMLQRQRHRHHLVSQRISGQHQPDLLYDGTLRMVGVQKNSATIAEFGYDGDGQMVTASIGGVTTSYVGGYFEWQTNGSLSTSTKYGSGRQGRSVTKRRPQRGLLLISRARTNISSLLFPRAASSTPNPSG